MDRNSRKFSPDILKNLPLYVVDNTITLKLSKRYLCIIPI